MSNDLAVNKPKFVPGRTLTGLAARKAAAALSKEELIEIPATEMKHRIGIVFDDSGSMSPEQIKDAHDGIEEFLRSCTKDETSVAIYPMNKSGLPLCKNLPAVAIFAKGIYSSGGTPLIKKTKEMFAHNNLTRAIVFSDGLPDTENGLEELISYGIPIDTVYIPSRGNVIDQAVSFMRKLAESTGGIYLQFERGKSNFRTSFKYLSPGLRYMLADKSFVQKLEGR